LSELSDPDVEELTAVLYGPEAPCEVPDLPVVHTEAFFDSGTIGELWKLQGEVDRWIIQAEQSVPFTVILRDRQATFEPRILRRGDPVNYGEDVPRHFLSLFVDGKPAPFEHGSGRRELGEKIVDPQNPLTVRVIVNRVWMQHFGQGLVTTPSDFGLRSTPPSHPELLDWLANEFQSHDWSLKHLHKLILTSQTFRQSSQPPEEETRHRLALQTDPENRLLWRMNPHRLTFEEFRDSLLAVTDDLDPSMGGKPGKIFEAPYPRRRTLYGLIDRQFLPSTLRIFDFANPDLHIPQRSETTVPQQSLFLMNHSLVLERVRSLASLARQHTSNSRQAIEAMFQHALQRSPSPNELQEAERFISLAETTKPSDVSPTTADWQYGYGSYDAAQQKTNGWTPLPHFTGQAWQGGPKWPDSTLGWVQLTAAGGHPGNTRDHACIRRWTAPRELTIRLQSSLINEPEAGDGVRAFVVSSSGGLLAEAHNHQQVSELNVPKLKVHRGDTIDFIVDIDEVLNSDQFLWEITVEEVDGETLWNSKDDFPQSLVNPLNAWEQLAQALLCTNEFMFVD
ncbi:MAG: DUF1553 domain-containing protein, partial [Planctomycetaceae bacterium]|nr:DUF1553 domain-containing protein [Planctomycetaceae bacterium]